MSGAAHTGDGAGGADAADARQTAATVDAVLRLVANAGTQRPIVLIDGRSGSGKTDLSLALAAAWPGRVELVHLDDIYPGWGGLDAASAHIHDELLTGSGHRYRRHDWTTGQPADWASIDPALPLIVEGIGALSRANAAAATVRVWLELGDDERRLRAIARDGAAYEPHWNEWAAAERAFIAREHPAALADLVVDRNPAAAGRGAPRSSPSAAG